MGIIGSDGFIGSHLVASTEGIGVNRRNYKLHIGSSFDVIINANGNSRKYWGNNFPLEEFDKSVLSVYKSLFDFKYKKYVYISSIDAEDRITPYGLHKYIAEEIVKQYCEDYSIVRLPAVIGAGAAKGVVADILNDKPIYLTSDSTLMIIDVEEVVMKLKEFSTLQELERFYPCDNVSIAQIGEILRKKVKYADTLRAEYYSHCGEFKNSIYYLNKII